MTTSFFGLFAAGLLTFVSPCVLPLMPILLASLMIGRDGAALEGGRHQRLIAALWFVAGFTVVFVLMGLSIPGLTRALGELKLWLLLAAGALLALFGLKMMGALPKFLSGAFSWMNRSAHLPGLAARTTARLPRGLQGLLFGSLFGLSWTPCVGPILGGVLTYVASKEATPWQGALLLLPFALGIGLPILALAWASDKVTPWLNRLKPHLGKIEYGIGLGLFVFGIYVANQGRLLAATPVASADAPSDAIVAVSDRGSPVVLNAPSQRTARLLFFYSESCPVCHAMEKFLPALEAGCEKENFELVRINVGRPGNSPAAQSFNVKAVPTIAVLNDRGDQVVHLVGYQTEARLLDALRTTAKLACKNSGLPAVGGLAPDATCNTPDGLRANCS